MSVRRREHGSVVVLDVGGEFYGDDSTDELERALKSEVERATPRLLLNLYDCRMMNSTTLGVMHHGKQALEAIGCNIRLCGLGDRMKSLLVVSRLMDWFRVHDTESEAVAALTKA